MGTGTACAPVHPSTGPGAAVSHPHLLIPGDRSGPRLSLPRPPDGGSSQPLSHQCFLSDPPRERSCVSRWCLGSRIQWDRKGSRSSPEVSLSRCWRPHLSHCWLLVCSPFISSVGASCLLHLHRVFQKQLLLLACVDSPRPHPCCAHTQPGDCLPVSQTRRPPRPSVAPTSLESHNALCPCPHPLLPRPLLRAWHHCPLHLE